MIIGTVTDLFAPPLIRPYFALLLMIPACALGQSPGGLVEAAMTSVRTEQSDDYPHQAVGHHAIGTAGSRVWIFFPDSPRPESANVVLFLHGYRAMDPAPYGGWIDHIAKEGSIVLYPLFEESRSDPPENSLRNAIESTKQALQYLADAGPVKPDLSNFSIVGHSFGGGLAAQVAGLAAFSGLPQPQAVMSVQPGWLASKNYPTDNLTRIPPPTYLLVVEGDKDQFQDTRHASTIFNLTTQIPPDRKALVRLRSTEGLIADHYAPLSPDPAYHLEEESAGSRLRKKVVKWVMRIREGETDALDRQGLWPMFDELMSVTASGGTIDTAVNAATVEIVVGQ
jgi:acetyl esterase/lipase